ncbi:Uncharacterised protein [Mycobacteroides abscessus subsp. abscessus]|nr:Uncharacterised protein [Mycobacteroides abscessus subsp. abscessus]
MRRLRIRAPSGRNTPARNNAAPARNNATDIGNTMIGSSRNMPAFASRNTTRSQNDPSA